MLRALLKKQLLELFSFYMINARSGKRRKPAEVLLITLLLLYGIGASVAMSCLLAKGLSQVILLGLEDDWLYFAFMGAAALLIGTFFGVLTGYHSLYQAGDNELLLSLPIPPFYVLLVRMLELLGAGLLGTLLVWLPACFFAARQLPGGGSIPYQILLLFLIPCLGTALAGAFSWLLAAITSRLRNKTPFVAGITLLFLLGYFYAVTKAEGLLTWLLGRRAELAALFAGRLYPFYLLGRAAMGKSGDFLLFAVLALAVSAAFLIIMTRSFISLITAERGVARRAFRESQIRSGSVERALLMRELRRFLNCAVYLLNGGFGIMLMLVGTVLLPLKRELASSLLEAFTAGFDGARLYPVLMTAAICQIASMNMISAPSVSLEGHQLWLIRSLPISALQILRAKERLHFLLNAVPALLLTITASLVLKLDLLTALLCMLVCLADILLMARLGLVFNLLFPNLEWTTETVPVKQGISVILTMLAGLLLCVGSGFLYVKLLSSVEPRVYLGGFALLLGIGAAGADCWLRRKGTGIFESL